MKYFDWNEEKNQLLKEERNISFEEIVLSITNDQLLDVLEHHDKTKYPNQKLIIVELRNYGYVVPFVETDKAWVLKTIYPSRKATRKYLRKGK